MSLLDLCRVESGSPIEVVEDFVVMLNGYSCLEDVVLRKRLVSQSVATHVWFFEVCSSTYLPLLSEEEKSRLSYYKFGEDSESYLFSHGLLRVLLGYYLGLDPRFVPINYGLNGRPTVSHREGFGVNISLSHSKRLVMYAFSKQRIGVDVERMRSDVDFDNVASNLLIGNDTDRFNHIPQLEKMALFYKMWTARESSYKVVGGKLSDFQIKLDGSFSPELSIGGWTPKLRVHFFKVFDDYIGALTVYNPD
ncbi:MAG: 4'-phosphopantetheinyl transferase superfamily protein [Candidatus Bathyarchaeota archaeon]|nr:4'-phosphopantetheinyl transferase superfamily protein [Candidatus Bathyarchaeota archaeon]